MEFLGASVEHRPFLLNLIHPGLPLYLLLGVIGIIGLFFLVLFIACLCERQFLSGDVEPVGEPFPYPPLPYWTATREDAQELGLRHGGDFATRKNTTKVKGLMRLFVSQDRRILAAIVSGSIAGAKTRKTILRSRLTSGRVLESCDDGGIDDLSGVVDRAILVNAGIVELMVFHIRRIGESGESPLPFESESLLEEFEKTDLERGARWVRLGLARWVDPQHASIRMTIRGAFAMVEQVARQTSKVRGQHHRIDIPRAGSRAGD